MQKHVKTPQLTIDIKTTTLMIRLQINVRTVANQEIKRTTIPDNTNLNYTNPIDQRKITQIPNWNKK